MPNYEKNKSITNDIIISFAQIKNHYNQRNHNL